MVNLILGRKGTGKTKRLIEMCEETTKTSKGNVVFIRKDVARNYMLSHKTRLVAADEFGIFGYDALYGFIAGMCAGNYDITDIFVDSTLKIGGQDLEQLAAFLEKLKTLSVRLVLAVSADKSEVPESVASLAI